MSVVVVYFSHTGNNRLLAGELARRMNGDVCEVVEQKRRTLLTIILDMMFRRTPRVEPLALRLADYDHSIFVAPVWDARVANPMAALMKREKVFVSSYSFISLCGYEREGQSESLAQQLNTLLGRPAMKVCELKVCQLLAKDRQNDIKAISRYRVAATDLTFFEPALAEFCQSIMATA